MKRERASTKRGRLLHRCGLSWSTSNVENRKPERRTRERESEREANRDETERKRMRKGARERISSDSPPLFIDLLSQISHRGKLPNLVTSQMEMTPSRLPKAAKSLLSFANRTTVTVSERVIEFRGRGEEVCAHVCERDKREREKGKRKRERKGERDGKEK